MSIFKTIQFHPNIIKFFGTSLIEDIPHIVTELADENLLTQLLSLTDELSLKESEISQFERKSNWK